MLLTSYFFTADEIGDLRVWRPRRSYCVIIDLLIVIFCFNTLAYPSLRTKNSPKQTPSRYFFSKTVAKKKETRRKKFLISGSYF